MDAERERALRAEHGCGVRRCREGLPISLLEAQSSGLPVVGFASAGIPEALSHDETGYLAPEKDWRALSGYLAKVLQDRDL